jgi:serine/threonine-protein kinase
MVGRKVGQYQFLEKLGAGGMGEIYKAQDTRLGRFVAIKVLPSAKSGDPERRRRFLQEAQAASGLNHPNIITIHDIVSEGDTEFMVMEYVAGRTLNDLIPKGGLRVPQALKYALQISDALNAAHAAGIVHRDLKPANIMVTDSGLIKVLDFGLAKLTDSNAITSIGEDAETIAATSPLTVEGSILGTVSYMSPEQAQGKKVDTRSDIFSFGAVFYEMLTGLRAFDGDSSLSTLSAILRDDVKPMIEVAPDVPPQLEDVLHQCLRKLPDDRMQSMRDVQAALAMLKRESDSGSLYGSRLAVPPMASESPVSTLGAGPASRAATPSASAMKSQVSKSQPSASGSQAPVSGLAVPPDEPSAASPAQVSGSGAKKSNSMIAIAAGVILLIAAGGGGLYMRQQAAKKAAAAQAQAAEQAAAEQAAQQAAAEKAAAEARAAELANQTVTNDSILDLVREKVPTTVILDQIRSASITKFDLSTPELIRLSKAGVTAAIIDQMRNPKKAAAPVVVAAVAPVKPLAGKQATPTPSPAPTTPAPSASNATPAPVAAATPAPVATAPPPPPTPAPAPKPQTTQVAVQDATPFRMILAEDVPANVDLGVPIKFTMAEDFKVGNTVVIARGMPVNGEISETAKKKKFLFGGTKLSFTLSKAVGAGGVELNVRALSARRADGATQRAVETGKTGNKALAAMQGAEYIGYIDGTQTVNVPK